MVFVCGYYGAVLQGWEQCSSIEQTGSNVVVTWQLQDVIMTRLKHRDREL